MNKLVEILIQKILLNLEVDSHGGISRTKPDQTITRKYETRSDFFSCACKNSIILSFYDTANHFRVDKKISLRNLVA